MNRDDSSQGPLAGLRARFLRTGREAAAALFQRVPEAPRNAILARVAALMPSPYHAGELEVQRRAGVGTQAARSGLGVGRELPRCAAELLARQPLLLVAALDERGRLWVTQLEGEPGFLAVEDPFTLRVAALPDPRDPLAAAIGDSSGPVEAGLLAIDFSTRERLRITGEVEATERGLTVRVRDALENCPRYVRSRDLRYAAKAQDPAAAIEADALEGELAERVRRADMVFVGSVHPERGCDVSHKGGGAGFLRVDGPRALTLPDYNGNGMFQTLGNVHVDPRIAILVPGLEDGGMLHVSGRASIDWDEAALRDFPRAERLVRIEVDAVRFCPAASTLRSS